MTAFLGLIPSGFCVVSETKARFCDYLGQHRTMCVSSGLLKSMNMTKICGNCLSRKILAF